MPDIVATVVEVRPEAPGAVTLRLEIEAPFFYRPGQYVEIEPHQFEELSAAVKEMEAKKGFPEGPRSFSLASDGLDPRFVELSIKEEKPVVYDPVVTPHLVRNSRPGMKIRLSGPNGQYCLPENSPPVAGLLHLCAGSGVAPNRGMIRHALAKGWPQRHLLVLQNRTPEDVFYKGEWPELLRRHSDRLRVQHIFSVTEKRHVNVEIVRAAMAQWFDGRDAIALVCGPNRPRVVAAPDGMKKKEPGFCEAWVGNPRKRTPGLLDQLGFAPDRILTEMW